MLVLSEECKRAKTPSIPVQPVQTTQNVLSDVPPTPQVSNVYPNLEKNILLERKYSSSSLELPEMNMSDPTSNV